MTKFSKGKRITILIMVILGITAILITKLYYQSINNAEDPRVVKAKHLYGKYNKLTGESNFPEIFLVLDSILEIYEGVPHYNNSFETGVIYNNKAASFLTMAIYNNKNLEEKNILLDTAKYLTEKAIIIYSDWSDKYIKLNKTDLLSHVTNDFNTLSESYNQKQIKKFAHKRTKEIELAKKEINRRLSVSHTNLGIIYRHYENYEQAAIQYKKAIDLWEHNYSAQNNLNKLLGRPVKKRNAIQKLFPPSKRM